VTEGPLRVSLTTRGGFAAGVVGARPARAVDTRGLTPAQDAELRRLLRAASRDAARPASRGAAEAPGAPAGPGGGGRPADVATYTVTVEPGGPVLRATDLDLSEALADLIDWIEGHAAGQQ